MVSILRIGKYITTAFLIHSLTCQPPFIGLATRKSPLSNPSITASIAFTVSSSFNKERSSQAFSIISFILIFLFEQISERYVEQVHNLSHLLKSTTVKDLDKSLIYTQKMLKKRFSLIKKKLITNFLRIKTLY